MFSRREVLAAALEATRAMTNAVTATYLMLLILCVTAVVRGRMCGVGGLEKQLSTVYSKEVFLGLLGLHFFTATSKSWNFKYRPGTGADRLARWRR